MGIKIVYSDETTGTVLAERTITDEQIKALSIDMVSATPEVVFLDWHDNAIQNKARQMIDKVCEDALNDQTNTILTTKEKQDIVTALAAEGRIISTVKQMPASIKHQIVSVARIKTAAERQAEFEASMPK